MNIHRKTVRHFHEPGDLHELTFSCAGRAPLLSNDDWRRQFCRSIDAAMARCRFGLVAFVLMPEHVHLLVDPVENDPARVDIAALLAAMKRPFSFRIKSELQQTSNPLLNQLTIRGSSGKTTFRFWQQGP
jgi:putative transposase